MDISTYWLENPVPFFIPAVSYSSVVIDDSPRCLEHCQRIACLSLSLPIAQSLHPSQGYRKPGLSPDLTQETSKSTIWNMKL